MYSRFCMLINHIFMSLSLTSNFLASCIIQLVFFNTIGQWKCEGKWTIYHIHATGRRHGGPFLFFFLVVSFLILVLCWFQLADKLVIGVSDVTNCYCYMLYTNFETPTDYCFGALIFQLDFGSILPILFLVQFNSL